MSVYVRRFLFDPGSDVLLNIESVNILDLDPPGSVKGVGAGTVLVVGEFENGPFGTVTEVASVTDAGNNGVTLGYTYNGVVGNYPSAIARKADGQLTPEYWNGNGFVQLNGKQFARLILCRVDTSVGSVQFSPQAYITGAAQFRYQLTAGAVLGLDLGSGASTATFNATAATVTSSGATYAVAAGDQVTLGYDGAPNFTVTFLSGDNSQGGVIARINAFAGFAMAATATGQFSLTGRQLGNQAQVRVVGSSSGGVLTALGLTIATTFGTGNVGNIAAVTPQEVANVVQGAISNTLVEVDANGALRISNTTGSAGSIVLVTSATTATALGFTAGQYGTVLGVAAMFGTTVSAMAANDSVTIQVDNNNPTTITFAGTETTATLIAAAINAAAPAGTGITVAYVDGTTLRLVGQSPGGKVAVLSASSGAVYTKLGLPPGVAQGAPYQTGPVIPAGTVVQVAGGQVFVTMQDVTFTKNGATVAGTGLTPTLLPLTGPYTVKVRHALDDGSGLAASAGTITSIPNAIAAGSFKVTNPTPTTAALTDNQVDAQYVAALAGTTDINTVGKQVNIVYSARQSNVVRKALKANALLASSQGCYGRVAVIRTPLGTLKATAMSTNAEPGVGAYRDQRVIYCFPQARTYVPLIARRGTAGNPAGTGYQAFTADGNVDVGADGFLTSIMSQLPPEENPGQETPFTGGIVAIESSANAQGFMMQDYINFKAAGICALRFDEGTAIFQSGVTSVDPLVNPQLVRISRRRMADFMQDSLAQRAKKFGKKLSTFARQKAMSGEVRSFLAGLLGKNRPGGQRIGGYTVDDNVSTRQELDAGLYRIKIVVKTLASLDSIVLETTVGETVTVNEVLPKAA